MDGGWFRELERVVASPQGRFNDPEQSLEVVGGKMVRPAALKLLRAVAAFQEKGAIGKQGEPCDGLVAGGVHGCTEGKQIDADQAVVLILSLRSTAMAVPTRGRRGMGAARSSSPWLGSFLLRPRWPLL